MSKIDHSFTTYAQRRAAVNARNAASFPGHSNFAAWTAWVRECHDRIEAFERAESEQFKSWAKEIAA